MKLLLTTTLSCCIENVELSKQVTTSFSPSHLFMKSALHVLVLGNNNILRFQRTHSTDPVDIYAK